MLTIVKEPSVQFVAGLAHEVRNPLTNIRLAVEMLETATTENERKLYLDIITRSTTRIDHLITELLTYQEPAVLQPEKHSLHKLLDEVIESAADRIRLQHITVRKEYAPHDCTVALSRPTMKIALTNIVINALEAMHYGKGELTIITKATDSRYIIHIEDNGCGISDENLKNIFKPFFTKKPNGLGLGLATTYEILRTNSVGVVVESKEDEGTTFMLQFDRNPG